MRGFGFELRDHGGKNLVGAEIGVFDGEHAESLLNATGIKTMYLVDPYQAYDDPGTADYQRSQDKLNEARNLALEKMVKFVDKVITAIYRTSTRAAVDIKDESLDFVYIDADHRKEFVLSDISVWTTKVKKGGLVGGHDYDNQHPELKKTVKDYCSKNGFKLESGNQDWWFWR